MHLTYRNTCRVCGSSALTKVIDLGEQYLQGSFIKEGKECPPTRKIPTILVRCDPSLDEKACGLLQMAHTVPPAILYASYWYRSGTNKTMRDHLSSIVADALEMAPGDQLRVLDIGCNDGTLLHAYPSAFQKYGVDPSDVAQTVGADVKVIQDTFPSAELTKLISADKFDIVTSIAMFYDLEDPVAFVRGIREVLSTQGLWIFEMSYMPSMLKLNSYDTICHEHLEYYSFTVLEHILSRTGMKVIRAELNEINGGSIRCYATHVSNFKFRTHEHQHSIETLRRKEFDLELDTARPYKNFQERINIHRDELGGMLRSLKRDGCKIHIYGASTKGNTILQWCDLNSAIIDYAADRNPDKHGARTIGTNIPIISEEESRAMRPDYYLVLPWHFKNEFIQREKEILRSGTRMIFPLPNIEIAKFSS
jgi:SAM-dependent methyltransferase